MTILSPEAEAVYATAGPPTQDDRIHRLVTGSFDWSRFLWIALKERAVSVAWRRFQRMGLTLPDEVGAQLQRHTMVADFTAARLEARLQQTLPALRSAGVDPALLKGAALARTLYPAFRDRPMGDIDILVAKEDAARALDVARSLEWEVVPEFADVDYHEHHHLPPMVDRTGAGRLEIHTALFVAGNPFGTFSDAVYHHSRAPLGHLDRVPTDVHLVLHLAVHFAWSHVMGLGAWRAFYDLATLTRHGRLDWQHVLAEAKAYRATTCCYWTLRLARDLAGVAIPPEVVRACRPPGGKWLHDRLANHFSAQLDGPDRGCPSVAVWRLLWRAAIRPGWSGHGARFPWRADIPFMEALEPSASLAPETALGPGAKAGKVALTARYLASIVLPGIQ